MITKVITFEDFNGKVLTEEFCFHLSEAAIIEMELSKKGGLTDFIKKIVAEEDGEKLVELFKNLLKKTVGRKSADGRRFEQNDEITNDFVQTNAYSKLFVELATNADQAAAFVNGIVPAAMQEELKKKETQTVTPALSDIPVVSETQQTVPQDSFEEKLKDPTWVPSPKDVREMSADQLARAFQRKQSQSEITP